MNLEPKEADAGTGYRLSLHTEQYLEDIMFLHSKTHNCRRGPMGALLGCLWPVLAVFVWPSHAAGADPQPPPSRVQVEYWVPKVEIDPQSPLWVGVTFTNISAERISERLPYEWKSRMKDRFDLFHNGTPVQSLVSKKKIVYKRITTLEDKESVSVLFRLGSIFDVPTDPRERIGQYELRLKKVSDSQGMLWLSAGTCRFSVVEEPPPVRLEISEIRTERDLAEAVLLMKQGALMREARLSLLKMALASRNREMIWGTIGSCDDPYALVEILEEIPQELIDPEALSELLQSNDLSVRRAALQGMKRLPESRQNRPMLRDFLQTQSDDIIREQVKQILGSR